MRGWLVPIYLSESVGGSTPDRQGPESPTHAQAMKQRTESRKGAKNTQNRKNTQNKYHTQLKPKIIFFSKMKNIA